ncbi:oxaloacetate decarboxylase (Na+ extruding) subunit alpha [Methylomarinovum tepidoasis]|uniref:Oxaloacetate decarboxylase (Na+ extruding) subunit alpha n=1 Tax=Methylomarinovum tepidoasis TaxID=2840183 RepID=A0AAU9CGN6_9GAMM|nr:sodium-extruding oxaloacetate decarboxylase subunit alpha [Methylomarinovum sp. IN45]BCX89408.1 oxaloacetate decarboxylase (Na+ extruding) subunit alpha [Methylomarinovum sp. IN45]
MSNSLGITEVVLRDAHQSLLATRLRLEDMLPICPKLDQIGFWSLEVWGGATFDACIRYLGEDPWERLRAFRKALPNTRLQMLLRGQNLLGYRHYADDVVDAFVERAAANGMDVFRIFDALNDLRNIEHAVKAVIACGKHAQGTLSYTTSPVHSIDTWVDLGRRIEDMGAHSVCIKDMAGLLTPHVATELVTRLKQHLEIPLHLHCHATTGLSIATLYAAAEAGIDNVDTAVSSMSMTYSHSPTETLIAMFQGHARDTGLDLEQVEEIGLYFREVRKKYARFEGNLKGVDSRILVAQVPGGMLTNMENQLKEQNAADKLDEVLEEIPRVRKDLGYIPLVTPSSQIVGTQAVINVLSGERYKTITKEVQALLRGEYGATPAPVNQELQQRVLQGKSPITCRPADLLPPEMEKLTEELHKLAREHGVKLAGNEIEDVLIYALFPQVGWKFIQERGNPAAFEPPPETETETEKAPAAATGDGPASYTVTVNQKVYHVEVAPSGQVTSVRPGTPQAAAPASGGESHAVTAPMAGTILKVNVTPGDVVKEGDVVVIMEAMKMETEVRAKQGGTVQGVMVKEGDAVAVDDVLLTLS